MNKDAQQKDPNKRRSSIRIIQQQCKKAVPLVPLLAVNFLFLVKVCLFDSWISYFAALMLIGYLYFQTSLFYHNFIHDGVKDNKDKASKMKEYLSEWVQLVCQKVYQQLNSLGHVIRKSIIGKNPIFTFKIAVSLMLVQIGIGYFGDSTLFWLLLNGMAAFSILNTQGQLHRVKQVQEQLQSKMNNVYSKIPKLSDLDVNAQEEKPIEFKVESNND